MESTEVYYGRIAFNAYHGYPKDNYFECGNMGDEVQHKFILSAKAIANHIAEGIAMQLIFAGEE